MNREADEGCKKPLERLLNIWQERSVYGSEFIQQLKLSMEDSNSPQTKGKCLLLSCLPRLGFKLVHVPLRGGEPWAPGAELLPELGREVLWDCLGRSLVLVKLGVQVCRCVAVGQVVAGGCTAGGSVSACGQSAAGLGTAQWAQGMPHAGRALQSCLQGEHSSAECRRL